MLGTLFAVICVGFIIIFSLFIYWLKYVYVDKDKDKGKKNKNIFPTSNDLKEIERRKNQIQLISQQLRKKNKIQNKNKIMNNGVKQPLKENKDNIKNINEIGAENNSLLKNQK